MTQVNDSEERVECMLAYMDEGITAFQNGRGSLESEEMRKSSSKCSKQARYLYIKA